MSNEQRNFRLVQAKASDSLAIRSLIHQAGINPIGLDWRRFILAVDSHNLVIGCGQLKPHHDGSLELASIAVVQEWRGKGVARQIITNLETAALGRSLYLTCRSGLGSFYEKLGYRVVHKDEMPRYLRRISLVASLLTKLRVINDSLLVMRKDL